MSSARPELLLLDGSISCGDINISFVWKAWCYADGPVMWELRRFLDTAVDREKRFVNDIFSKDSNKVVHAAFVQ
jgi:hypothetical protein